MIIKSNTKNKKKDILYIGMIESFISTKISVIFDITMVPRINITS